MICVVDREVPVELATTLLSIYPEQKQKTWCNEEFNLEL
jgi:hypothetical protein